VRRLNTFSDFASVILAIISFTLIVFYDGSQKDLGESRNNFKKACNIIADQEKTLNAVDRSDLDGTSVTLDRGASDYEKAGCNE
jgi:hypothetical protein